MAWRIIKLCSHHRTISTAANPDSLVLVLSLTVGVKPEFSRLGPLVLDFCEEGVEGANDCRFFLVVEEVLAGALDLGSGRFLL